MVAARAARGRILERILSDRDYSIFGDRQSSSSALFLEISGLTIITRETWLVGLTARAPLMQTLEAATTHISSALRGGRMWSHHDSPALRGIHEIPIVLASLNFAQPGCQPSIRFRTY